MAGRIVLTKKFGRSGKVVPALLETPPAWTIHGVPGRGDNRCRHWMASQGIEKAPGVLDVSVCLQHDAVLDQMEPLPR